MVASRPPPETSETRPPPTPPRRSPPPSSTVPPQSTPRSVAAPRAGPPPGDGHFARKARSERRRPAIAPPSITVLRRPPESTQYVSIRYTERLVEAGIEPSVGSVGDSYDSLAAPQLRCTLVAPSCGALYRQAGGATTDAAGHTPSSVADRQRLFGRALSMSCPWRAGKTNHTWRGEPSAGSPRRRAFEERSPAPHAARPRTYIPPAPNLISSTTARPADKSSASAKECSARPFFKPLVGSYSRSVLEGGS